MTDFATTPSVDALRLRIGTLCQVLRFSAVAYAVWVFALLAMHWANADEVTRAYSHWLRAPLSEVPSPQRAAGFVVQMAAWSCTAVACWNLWKLFGGFLAGRVFTLDAAKTLRCLSLAGLTAVAIDMACRPLLSILMTIHMAPGSRHVGFFFDPHDLLNLMFLGGLLALAQVFKVAAEIAEDNAAIV